MSIINRNVILDNLPKTFKENQFKGDAVVVSGPLKLKSVGLLRKTNFFKKLILSGQKMSPLFLPLNKNINLDKIKLVKLIGV